MTKRDIALAGIRVAGHHNDRDSFVRLYAENRIAYVKALNAYNEGQRARHRGVPCSCPECRKG